MRHLRTVRAVRRAAASHDDSSPRAVRSGDRGTQNDGIPATPDVYDVCAAVVSDLSVDARVWKEARSLRGAGYSLMLIGCRYETSEVVSRRQHYVDLVEVPLGSRRGHTSLRGRLRTLMRVWRTVLRTRAHAYHAHNIHVVPACWVAARLRRARLIYDAHELYGCLGADDSRGRRPLAWASRAAESFAVRHADAVITTNESRVLALQARHGLLPVEVLANVPRLVEVEPADPGFPPGVPILLYQGGIYAESRAFRETICSLRYLDGVHFVILGFGRERDLDLIRSWSEEAEVDSRVHLLPPVPFDSLVGTAALATVGLAPIKPIDLGHVLGDTNKLHEYLMAGLPVIGSDIPEIRRVLAQGTPRIGEVFDPLDPRSIADAYRRVTRNPHDYRARRQEARRLATELHHWGREERRLLAVYERLLGPAGSEPQAERPDEAHVRR